MDFLPLTLLFPLALMGLMVVMERVEAPLRRASVGEQLEAFFDSARPEDVETFVSEGAAPALEKYWRQRRFSGLLPGRPR